MRRTDRGDAAVFLTGLVSVMLALACAADPTLPARPTGTVDAPYGPPAPTAAQVPMTPDPSPTVAPRTPELTGGIGEPASYCKPGYCATPAPPRQPGMAGNVGLASWYGTGGPGEYGALPGPWSEGRLAVMCVVAEPMRCLTVPVVTSCGCAGPPPKLIDLSPAAFRALTGWSAARMRRLGVVHITLEVVK